MKKESLQRIWELTQLQQTALKEENIEQWVVLMEERQKEMNRLDGLRHFNSGLEKQKENTMLQEIILLDNRNKEEFQRQFEEVKSNLKKIRSQKKIGNIYSNPYDVSQEEGIFFDKK